MVIIPPCSTTQVPSAPSLPHRTRACASPHAYSPPAPPPLPSLSLPPSFCPALSTTRYDSAKEDPDDPTKGLFRRRGRPSLLEGGGKGGGGGGKSADGVELTLLSESSGGDGGGRLSPPPSRSITGGGGSGGGGGAIGGGRRDTSPPPGGQQATFYL